ncbi:tyrosine-type recombinase/integrase [Deinococcus aestuarii]|uniref:tyrosine-type recombinase/integrase n=1 Tax=Deinococcus aestuarii TaxID=2774531 RepID=UPI001C0D9501|nr:hypothetical protein [Deinococcus aestuarii]
MIDRSSGASDEGDAARRAHAERAVQNHDEAALWEVLHAYLIKYRTPSAPTLRAYRTGLGVYLQFLNEEGHHLSRPPAMQDYGDWLMTRNAVATARGRLVAATHLLTALRRQGALPVPPPLTVALAAPTAARRTEAYTDAEVDALLARALPEERIILLLALEGGLSTGEIAALRRDQVMLDEAFPHLLVQTETDDPQRVDLTPRLQQELRSWFGATPTRSGAVTAGTTQPYLDYTVKALCGRAGVPYKGLRALRVTAGARRFRETGDAHAVRRFLRLADRAQVSLYTEAAARLSG